MSQFLWISIFLFSFFFFFFLFQTRYKISSNPRYDYGFDIKEREIISLDVRRVSNKYWHV